MQAQTDARAARTSFLETVRTFTADLERSDANPEPVLEFLTCYQRFATAVILFRILKSDARRRLHLRGILKFILLWVDIHYASDFLERRIGQLISLFALIGPQHTDSINRVKLMLLKKNYQLQRDREAFNHDLLGLSASALATAEACSVKRFFSYPATVVAEQWTLLEWSLFSSVKFEEFFDKGWLDPARAPALHALVSRTGQVSQWIASTILCQKTVQTQRRALCRFIFVARLCEQLGNYNAITEVLGALQLQCIARLMMLWKLDDRYLVIIRSLKGLMNPHGNYANYRKVLLKRMQHLHEGTATMPFIGVVLKDLAFIEETNADMVEGGDINMRKVAMVGGMLRCVRAFQNVRFRQMKHGIGPLIKHLWTLPRLPEAQLQALSYAVLPQKPQVPGRAQLGSQSLSDALESGYSIDSADSAGGSSGRSAIPQQQQHQPLEPDPEELTNGGDEMSEMF